MDSYMWNIVTLAKYCRYRDGNDCCFGLAINECTKSRCPLRDKKEQHEEMALNTTNAEEK